MFFFGGHLKSVRNNAVFHMFKAKSKDFQGIICYLFPALDDANLAFAESLVKHTLSVKDHAPYKVLMHSETFGSFAVRTKDATSDLWHFVPMPW